MSGKSHPGVGRVASALTDASDPAWGLDKGRSFRLGPGTGRGGIDADVPASSPRACYPQDLRSPGSPMARAVCSGACS